MSVIVKAHLQKTTKINDNSQEEASDSSSESDNEASDGEAEYSASSSDSNNDQEESDSECLSNVSNCTFRGMRIYDTVKPSLAQSYFKVSINGQTKFLHKQTACWSLMHDKTTLSSDRTTRVMNKFIIFVFSEIKSKKFSESSRLILISHNQYSRFGVFET